MMMREPWFWVMAVKMLAAVLLIAGVAALPIPWLLLALPMTIVWFWAISKHPEWWMKVKR